MKRDAKIIPIERGLELRREAAQRVTAKTPANHQGKTRTFPNRRPGLSFMLWVGIGLSALIWTYVQMPADLAESSAYYRYCTDAHARGVYNIPRDHPSYRSELDADRDGFACEPMPR